MTPILREVLPSLTSMANIPKLIYKLQCTQQTPKVPNNSKEQIDKTKEKRLAIKVRKMITNFNYWQEK